MVSRIIICRTSPIPEPDRAIPVRAGCISPYFVTNAEKMRAEMEDPYLLIYEKKLSALNELLALLEAVVPGWQATAHHCGRR